MELSDSAAAAGAPGTAQPLPGSLPCCRLHKKEFMHIRREGGELRVSLVRFKAPGFMCQFAFAFKKSANAWLNLKGRCEGGRGRRAKGGEKQRPKILPDFRGFRLASPTHPTPWQNILGGT